MSGVRRRKRTSWSCASKLESSSTPSLRSVTSSTRAAAKAGAGKRAGIGLAAWPVADQNQMFQQGVRLTAPGYFPFARGLPTAVIAASTLSFNITCAQTNEFLPEEPSPWDKSLNLQAGFGYKDNLALSPTNREHSIYVLSGLDLTVLRLPLD